MEFLRNFYAVFPEYKTMDVGFINLFTLATVLSGPSRPTWPARAMQDNTFLTLVSPHFNNVYDHPK